MGACIWMNPVFAPRVRQEELHDETWDGPIVPGFTALHVDLRSLHLAWLA